MSYQNVSRAVFAAMLMVCLLASAAQPPRLAAAEPQPRNAGQTQCFKSDLPFEVVKFGLDDWSTEFERLGETPTRDQAVLIIRPGTAWGVWPKSKRDLKGEVKKIDDEQIEIIFQCLQQQSVPGLILRGHQVTDEILAKLATLPSLRSLAILESRVTAKQLDLIVKLQQLQGLYLWSRDGLTDDDFARVSKLPNLHTLAIGGGNKLTDACLAHLAKLKGLRELDLILPSGITVDGLRHLQALRELRRLQFSFNHHLTGADLAFLSDFPKLETLSLAHCHKLDSIKEIDFTSLPRLKELDLRETAVMDEALTNLANANGLERLNLSSCEKLTHECLKTVGRLKRLRSLNLNHSNVAGPGTLHLSNLQNLESLEFYGTNATDSDLAHIGTLLQLRSLAVSEYGRKRRITNTGMRHLGRLRHLETLYLARCDGITDVGVGHLAKLPHLQTLRLPSSITDKGLFHLRQTKSLSSLSIRLSRVTDRGVAHLSQLPRLRVLDLAGTLHLTDDGLRALAKVVSLEELYVNGLRNKPWKPEHSGMLLRYSPVPLTAPQLTDKGVTMISRMPALRVLNISECKQLTKATLQSLRACTSLESLTVTYLQFLPEEVAAFKAALPGIEIIREPATILGSDSLLRPPSWP